MLFRVTERPNPNTTVQTIEPIFGDRDTGGPAGNRNDRGSHSVRLLLQRISGAYFLDTTIFYNSCPKHQHSERCGILPCLFSEYFRGLRCNHEISKVTLAE